MFAYIITHVGVLPVITVFVSDVIEEAWPLFVAFRVYVTNYVREEVNANLEGLELRLR